MVSKRAFDRLDASPFDFDAVSKRFDDGFYLYHDSGRVKRAFDRLEDSGFFGLRRRRRAFDRIDHSSFLTGSKRSGRWCHSLCNAGSEMQTEKYKLDNDLSH